jgi:hypothetical protein
MIDDESGITIYCTFKNGELRKYYATIMTYLSNQSIIDQIQPIVRQQISDLQIHNEFGVILDQTKR